VACVRCSLGELLTNGNVIDIFHACFRIGHYQPERSKGTTGGAKAVIPSWMWHHRGMHGQRYIPPAAVSVVMSSRPSDCRKRTIVRSNHEVPSSQDRVLRSHTTLRVVSVAAATAQSCSPRRRGS